MKQQMPTNHLISRAGRRLVYTLTLGLIVGLVPVLSGTNGNAYADDLGQDRGILDTVRVPSAHTLGTEGPAAPQELSIAELKKERNELKQLEERDLQNLAGRGDRSAQLVLAEQFATEAKSLAFAPVAANSALSDAVYWYTQAASRGFPGAAAVDNTFPLFPVRAFRTQPNTRR